MKVLIACKRGGMGPRDSSGHCRCDACNVFNRARYRRSNAKLTEYRKTWAKENPEKASAYSKTWISKNKERRGEIERAWKLKKPRQGS